MKNLQQQERLIELLTEKEIYGLADTENRELNDLLKIFPEWNDDETLALTAAAISLSGVRTIDAMPVNLKSRVLADAERFYAARETSAERSNSKYQAAVVSTDENQGFFGRLFGGAFGKFGGWALAAACAVLALNLWLTRVPNSEVTRNPPVENTPKPEPNLTEQRNQLIASASDKIQTTWTDFNPKQPKNVTGDVVWSNSLQKGYVKLHGLPVNDKAKETYQLWIFDAEQNPKTPVDGGVFDVDQNGDLIIPINAKIKVRKPTMFAVTAEKPGGVVVSDLSKVMSVAKV